MSLNSDAGGVVVDAPASMPATTQLGTAVKFKVGLPAAVAPLVIRVVLRPSAAANPITAAQTAKSERRLQR